MKTLCEKCDKNTLSVKRGDYYVCVWCNVIKVRIESEIEEEKEPTKNIDKQGEIKF